MSNANKSMPGVQVTARVAVAGDGEGQADDQIAAEVPLAMVYNGVSHAVMMATPADLEDLALGFSLSEGILAHADELFSIEVQPAEQGITLAMEIDGERAIALKQWRRTLAGRIGCGPCGVDSLAHAVRPVCVVDPPEPLRDEAIQQAVRDLKDHQPLQALTGATHAAAWCGPDGLIRIACEDIGRHNALDKLIGQCVRGGKDLAAGFVLISSRASFEMVQKSAAVGIRALVAVSAPTALAVQHARQARMALVGFARSGRHVIYCTGQDQPMEPLAVP